MVQREFIRNLAAASNLTFEEAATVIDAMTTIIIGCASTNEPVYIGELGSFKPFTSAPRVGYDFKTGGQVAIPPHRNIKFVPSKRFKQAIM